MKINRIYLRCLFFCLFFLSLLYYYYLPRCPMDNSTFEKKIFWAIISIDWKKNWFVWIQIIFILLYEKIIHIYSIYNWKTFIDFFLFEHQIHLWNTKMCKERCLKQNKKILIIRNFTIIIIIIIIIRVLFFPNIN